MKIYPIAAAAGAQGPCQADNAPEMACSAGARCPKCNGVGRQIRTRYFEGSAADVWECQSPACSSFGLLWHLDRPFNSEEEGHIRHRVMVAESALLKAKNAVAEAEVELAVARRLAAALPPNVQDEPLLICTHEHH